MVELNKDRKYIQKEEGGGSNVGLRNCSTRSTKRRSYSYSLFESDYWFFDSISQISKDYYMSESKVKSMLYRTRNKLKDYLIKEGVEF